MNTFRKNLAGIILGSMLVFFFSGILRFPDSPIQPCGVNKFCGKQGQPHTLEEYNSFKTWETILLWVWLPGLITVVALRGGTSSKPHN
jgi:hypothetical protein